MKSKLTAVAICCMLAASLLTACGGGGGGSGTTTTTTLPANQTKSELLLGTWTFTYTIVSTWTDVYTFRTSSASTAVPGDWNVFGTDAYGNTVIGGFNSSSGKWSVLSSGAIIDQFYFFLTDGQSVSSGCYYLITKSTGAWSPCYALSGTKTPLVALSTALPPSNPSGKSLAETAMANEVTSNSQPPMDVMNQYNLLKQ